MMMPLIRVWTELQISNNNGNVNRSWRSDKDMAEHGNQEDATIEWPNIPLHLELLARSTADHQGTNQEQSARCKKTTKNKNAKVEDSTSPSPKNCTCHSASRRATHKNSRSRMATSTWMATSPLTHHSTGTNFSGRQALMQKSSTP